MAGVWFPMKLPKLPAYLASLSAAIFTLAQVGAHAQGDGTNLFTPPSLVIALEERATLSPPVSPVGIGAAAAIAPVPITTPSGGANVEAINVDGKKDAAIQVSARDLAADTYTIAVKKKSDGSVVTLGTFTVDAVVTPVGAAVAPVDTDGDSDGSLHNGGRKGRTRLMYGTRFGTPLPAGFDGFDVASLSISDSKGVVALTGDLTQNSDLVKRARLVADASVPKASGYVSIFTSTRAGVVTSRFSLIASGLTANAALQLAINGADVQAVKPDSHGRVNVRSLPATVNLPAVQKVAIHDAANVNLLSVSF